MPFGCRGSGLIPPALFDALLLRQEIERRKRRSFLLQTEPVLSEQRAPWFRIYSFAPEPVLNESPPANAASMKKRKSTSGAVIAGGYLLLTLAAASPLVQEVCIGYGNGRSFLLVIALSSPLSVILLLLNDLFSGQDPVDHAPPIRVRSAP
jgi:hypothetical protein